MVVEAIDLDGLTLDSFRGRPVAVLGLARSGIALCRFLADRGAVVTGYDARTAGELSGLDRLESRPVRLWGISAAKDQNLGGILMSTEQALVLFAAIVWLLVRLFREEDEAERALQERQKASGLL